MTRDEAIEKLKKLLRIKRGGTQDEVATALRLAQELAAKHDIDLNTINPDEETKRITHEDASSSGRIQFECRYSMLLCEKFFNVSAFIYRGYRNSKIRFVGTSWDIQIACYIYTFLVREFRYAWNHRPGRIRNRQAFLYGMYISIYSKLDEKRAITNSEAGLIVLDKNLPERKRYIDNNFGSLTTGSLVPKDNARLSRYCGYQAGSKVNLNSGIEDAPKKSEINGSPGRMLLTE